MGGPFFQVSYVVLWILVVSLLVATFLLYHHYGQQLLNTTEARRDQGPKVNMAFPRLDVYSMDGAKHLLGQPGLRPNFVFFATPWCKVCLKARSALRQFAERYRGVLDVLVFCAGEPEGIRDFARDLGNVIQVVPDRGSKVFSTLRITSTPFAAIIDTSGVVRGKGMPYTVEGFEWFARRLDSSESDGDQISGLAPESPLQQYR